jgi:hypothetical protein
VIAIALNGGSGTDALASKCLPDFDVCPNFCPDFCPEVVCPCVEMDACGGDSCSGPDSCGGLDGSGCNCNSIPIVTKPI